jgi:protein phosphatase 1H
MRGDLKLIDANTSLPYVMFSMFDGHAGYQVALTARLHLHWIILVNNLKISLIVKKILKF